MTVFRAATLRTLFFAFHAGAKKSTSISKLELVAATMSSHMDKMLRLELEGAVTTSVFWSVP